MLKEPFQLLAKGVRAVETITADVMVISKVLRTALAHFIGLRPVPQNYQINSY
jgi:hypothetical protein